MFVVLSGQMKYGSIERREYQAIAHCQAQQVSVGDLVVSEEALEEAPEKRDFTSSPERNRH